VLCFANTAATMMLAAGDVPVRATLTTVAALHAAQVKPPSDF
jgi:hypothetical protein